MSELTIIWTYVSICCLYLGYLGICLLPKRIKLLMKKLTIKFVIDAGTLIGTLIGLYLIGYLGHSNMALDIFKFVIGRFIFLGHMAIWMSHIHPAVLFTAIVISTITSLLWKVNFGLTFQQINTQWKFKCLVFLILGIGGANSVISILYIVGILLYGSLGLLVYAGFGLLYFPILAVLVVLVVISVIGYLMYAQKNQKNKNQKKHLQKCLQKHYDSDDVDDTDVDDTDVDDDDDDDDDDTGFQPIDISELNSQLEAIRNK
jgi:uncharacterized membrane protein